jgi:hypothetical protein
MPLFVVTGPSGTGKTTVTGPLRGLLPDCDVFEADLTWHIATVGHDNWRNTWLQLAHGVGLNGRVTILCGSLTPDQLERLPARRLIGPITSACSTARRRPGEAAPCPPGMARHLHRGRHRPAPAIRRLAAHAHQPLLRHEHGNAP